MTEFINKDTVHPTVQYLRDEFNLTWRQLGEKLSERLHGYGFDITPSVSNVRNYATGRSGAWWFWGQISDMVIEVWQQNRNESTSDDERRQVDLTFASLFSDELMHVYEFFYAVKSFEDECPRNHPVITSGMANANFILHENERVFDVRNFPDVT
jgi:hypothetical protein